MMVLKDKDLIPEADESEHHAPPWPVLQQLPEADKTPQDQIPDTPTA